MQYVSYISYYHRYPMTTLYIAIKIIQFFGIWSSSYINKTDEWCPLYINSVGTRHPRIMSSVCALWYHDRNG